jgi:polyhydroxybutyrate depolymerase
MKKLLFAILLVFSLPAHAADTKTVSLTVDKQARTYIYHKPRHATEPLPVVLVLHDVGGTAEAALKDYHWLEASDADGFLVVGLQALPVEPGRAAMYQTNPSIWSDGSGRGNAKRGNLDDSAYVRAVLEDLGKDFDLDPKRIYAAGFANGGSMAQLLASKLSDKLAAVASVAGHRFTTDTPHDPEAILLLYGGVDFIDPLDGSAGINPWTRAPDPKPAPIKSAEGWAQALGCSNSRATATLAHKVSETLWHTCRDGASVTYLVVPDLGHHWPGGEDDQLPPDLTGPNSDALDATTFIWNFFKNHPKS